MEEEQAAAMHTQQSTLLPQSTSSQDVKLQYTQYTYNTKNRTHIFLCLEHFLDELLDAIRVSCNSRDFEEDNSVGNISDVLQIVKICDLVVKAAAVRILRCGHYKILR
eukprot:m.74145 g.74145  ORF g.74145 m.74145 type:complete len:108 (+) comp11793_c0_seq1:653-976(+)